ncbi:MAG: hypothetical protein ACLFR5_01615 [Halobacteriales archaeon]
MPCQLSFTLSLDAFKEVVNGRTVKVRTVAVEKEDEAIRAVESVC